MEVMGGWGGETGSMATNVSHKAYLNQALSRGVVRIEFDVPGMRAFLFSRFRGRLLSSLASRCAVVASATAAPGSVVDVVACGKSRVC
mmetsp:Transcript_7222/g.14853  ORF Transcript_7222/g.14853 Transcript_7222/m.14853 type:complete len:88 (-) Transcript_7222:451-714(-)